MSEEKMDTGLTPMPLESETRPSVDGSTTGCDGLEAENAHLRKSIANSDRDHWFGVAGRLREALVEIHDDLLDISAPALRSAAIDHARQVAEMALACEAAINRWRVASLGYCEKCEGYGWHSQLAPCTTSGHDCACHGTRIIVTCDACGGCGLNPSSSGPLASTEPPGVSPLNPSPSAVSGQEGGEDR